MIRLFFVFVILVMQTLPVTGQDDANMVKVDKPVTYPALPTSIGQIFRLSKAEMPASAPKQPAQYLFTNVNLGQIKGCAMSYEMHGDTIHLIDIYLPDEKRREQAKKQGYSQFGKPKYDGNDLLQVLGWLHHSEEKEISIALVYHNGDPVSEMIIKEKL